MSGGEPVEDTFDLDVAAEMAALKLILATVFASIVGSSKGALDPVHASLITTVTGNGEKHLQAVRDHAAGLGEVPDPAAAEAAAQRWEAKACSVIDEVFGLAKRIPARRAL